MIKKINKNNTLWSRKLFLSLLQQTLSLNKQSWIATREISYNLSHFINTRFTCFLGLSLFFTIILYVKYKDRHLQYHNKRLPLLSDCPHKFISNLFSECFSVEEWLEVFHCGTKAVKIVVIWSKGPSNTIKNLEILIIKVLKILNIIWSF